MDDILKLKIEAYISNSMSKEEIHSFEKQLKNDVELKKEVELAKELNHFLKDDVINKHSDTELSKKINTFLESEEATGLENKLLKVKNEYKTAQVKPKNKKYLLVAASIVFLLISSIGYYFLNQNNSEKLFTQYYSANDLPSVIKRGNQQDNLIQGVLKFKESDYTEALKMFDSYKNTDNNLNPSVYLYAGIANMELELYDKALLEFDKMILSNSIDYSKGLWFKALLYLKKQDKVNAKIILKKIVENSESFKFKEAEELLRKL